MTDIRIRTIHKAASSEIKREGYSLDTKGVTNWLISKNIISTKERLTKYCDISPWKQAGSETYTTIFEITTSRIIRKIIIKAIVTMFPEKSLLDWTRRRNILAETGVPVSNWYSTSKGTIYEDFYPFTAKEKVNFETLLTIGQKLDFLGFTTLKFIDDIRADKKGQPYYIDFGFDLGEPSNDRILAAKEYLIKTFPDKVLEINNFYGKNESL